MKYLSVKERFEALLQGKKIKESDWRGGSYLCLTEKGIVNSIDELGNTRDLGDSLVNWVLVEEPEIELTPEDVGRKMRFKNGDIYFIVGYSCKDNTFLIGTTWCNYHHPDFKELI